MSLSSFSVRRSVTTGMIFLSAVLLGAVAFTRLPVDMFPDIELPTVSVVTYYIGASAADVDEKLTDVLEDSLAVTPDLEEMHSISRENVSIITLQFAWGSNLDEAMADVRTRIDFARRELPDDAEDPLLLRVNLSMLPIVTLGVTSADGDVQDQGELIEELVINRLERLDGVASVTATNQRQRQVLVEVDRERLEDYGISLQQVAQMIEAENVTLPAGSLNIGRRRFTLRVPGELETIEELRDVIVHQHQGALVYLRDVATVREGLEESQAVSMIGGRPAIIMLVQRESGANTVDVATEVVELVDQLNRELPQGLEVVVLSDESRLITMMMDHLSGVVYWGGVLVIVIAFLFLRRLRTTLIVTLTIPTCLIAVFALLFVFGYTLNMVSMASLALAIGVVVDNSIVVVENVVRHIEDGKSRREGSIDGAAEVSSAVIAASLTNVAIFAPVLFVGGLLGVFFDLFAFIIMAAVAMSLLAALMLAPMLSSKILSERDARQKGWLYERLGAPMELLEGVYDRLIRRAIASRRTMASVIGLSVIAFAASMSTALLIGQDFMPAGEGGNLSVAATLPTGTTVSRTAEVAREMVEIIEAQVPEAELTWYRVGRSTRGLDMGSGAADNVALLGAKLPPLSERSRDNDEIEAELRPSLEALPGVVSLDVGGGGFSSLSGSSGGGRALTMEIFAGDDATARDVALVVRELVEGTPGTTDVASDLAEQTPELRVEVDRRRAARLGVPMGAVAAAVRFAVHGHGVTRFRGGDSDVDLVLRLRPEDRDSFDDLDSLTVPSLSGAQVRLDNISRITEEGSPVELRRRDGNRALRVMSNVGDRPMNEIRADLERGLAAARADGQIPRQVDIRFAGDIEEQRTMIQELSLALILAILLVYIVMAAQFESFLDPFVIMFSVPFGITGAFLALLITGVTLQLTSFLGMIIIVGIVVNNAIVLLDYINEMRRQGIPLHEAVALGGARRLRPVLMTSLTTIGGMFPLAIATGEGANIWQPLGIACCGGLLLSMFVTLVLIPTVYVATERWRTIHSAP